jgi:hypothetical protein
MNYVGTGSGECDWVKAHSELTALARCRAALDWEEGTALLRALRCGAHRHLGHASFAEYVERLFGYKPRATEDRLRAAQALESLPEMIVRSAMASSAGRRLASSLASPHRAPKRIGYGRHRGGRSATLKGWFLAENSAIGPAIRSARKRAVTSFISTSVPRHSRPFAKRWLTCGEGARTARRRCALAPNGTRDLARPVG